MNHFGRSASLFMGHIGLVFLCFILFFHLHDPFHSNKQHVGNQVMVSAMKTDEIIMTILAAKLLGLFKNDQQKSKPPPPPPPPPPPIAYPIIGACGRPKKCRKGGFQYFDLPDAYDDDDDFSVGGGAFNHFGDDLDDPYTSGEMHSPAMEMEYGNQYPTTYLTPDTPTATVYQQAAPQQQPMQNYQTNYVPAGGGGGGSGGGVQHQESYPPEQHSQAMQYSEPNTNEMDQSSSDTNRDFVTPRVRLSHKRKRLRKYFERAKKNRRGKGHRSTAKARRFSKSKQLKKVKTRTRRRKIRKLKPALVEQEELEDSEEDNSEHSDEQNGQDPLSKQQQQQQQPQVIHLGQKPHSSHNQQEEDEESEQPEHVKLEEEPEEEELSETTTILSITTANSNSTATPIITSTLSSTSTSSEEPKQLIISYTTLQHNNNKTVPEEQSEQSDHLAHDSKIMKMVPKKVRKYLEKLKLWNNKRLKKKKPQTLSNDLSEQQDSDFVEKPMTVMNVMLDHAKPPPNAAIEPNQFQRHPHQQQALVPSLHDGEQDESPYNMGASSGEHYNIDQAIPYDTYASMYGGAPDQTSPNHSHGGSIYASGPITSATTSASPHHSHEGIYMTPLAPHPPSPPPALLPPLIINPGDIVGEEYLFSPIMRRKSEQQKQKKTYKTEKREPTSQATS